MACATQGLRKPAAELPRSDVMVEDSMGALQVRASTPDVVIHGLPSYEGVTQIIIEPDNHLHNLIARLKGQLRHDS